MRIGELSSRSGVAAPTIKYYLREGLLTAGQRTHPNQVSYSEEHLRRLRLVRALIEVGGLSVATVKGVVAAVDAPNVSMHSLLGVVSANLDSSEEQSGDPQWQRARADVEALLRRHDVLVKRDSPSLVRLTSVLVNMFELGYESWAADLLDTYLRAAIQVAGVDVDYMLQFTRTDEVLDASVVLTVLGDTAFGALRRIAHEDASARRLGVRGEDTKRPSEQSTR